jgi:N-acetylneuraminate synthase
MCSMREVGEAVDAIVSEGNDRLVLLHAVTSYPTHAPDVNLGAMQAIKTAFPQFDVGYSDHTLSPVASLCAVAMGARVVERHFTHDKNADGPDHMLSSDPAEMKWLVDAIRAFEVMKGSGVKRPADSEKLTRRNNRKSIVVSRAIAIGSILTAEDLAVKRPGFGIAPKFFEQIVGRRVNRELARDSVLSWGDLW